MMRFILQINDAQTLENFEMFVRENPGCAVTKINDPWQENFHGLDTAILIAKKLDLSEILYLEQTGKALIGNTVSSLLANLDLNLIVEPDQQLFLEMKSRIALLCSSNSHPEPLIKACYISTLYDENEKIYPRENHHKHRIPAQCKKAKFVQTRWIRKK